MQCERKFVEVAGCLKRERKDLTLPGLGFVALHEERFQIWTRPGGAWLQKWNPGTKSSFIFGHLRFFQGWSRPCKLDIAGDRLRRCAA